MLNLLEEDLGWDGGAGSDGRVRLTNAADVGIGDGGFASDWDDLSGHHLNKDQSHGTGPGSLSSLKKT